MSTVATPSALTGPSTTEDQPAIIAKHLIITTTLILNQRQCEGRHQLQKHLDNLKSSKLTSGCNNSRLGNTEIITKALVAIQNQPILHSMRRRIISDYSNLKGVVEEGKQQAFSTINQVH